MASRLPTIAITIPRWCTASQSRSGTQIPMVIGKTLPATITATKTAIHPQRVTKNIIPVAVKNLITTTALQAGTAVGQKRPGRAPIIIIPVNRIQIIRNKRTIRQPRAINSSATAAQPLLPLRRVPTATQLLSRATVVQAPAYHRKHIVHRVRTAAVLLQAAVTRREIE